MSNVPKKSGTYKKWDEVWAELKREYPESIAEAEKFYEILKKFETLKKKEEIKKETEK